MEDERKISNNLPTIQNLLYDLSFDILSRLLVKPLVQCTSVSKPFKSLIQTPLFIKLYLAKTFIRKSNDGMFICIKSARTETHVSFCIFNSAAKTLVSVKTIELPFKVKSWVFRVVNSSNGLVCFFETDQHSGPGILSLWNPSLEKFKVVTDPHLFNRNKRFNIIIGFAFVSKISDFKIVQIMYGSNTDSDRHVFVYTLGEDSWQKIDALVPCDMVKYWSDNVFVSGLIHWMALTRKKRDNISNRIMLFNMSKEVFGEFELPKNLDSSYRPRRLVASCGGDSLSLFTYFSNCCEVWLMREYGVVESWVKQYNIVESQIEYPLRFMDNGDILVEAMNGDLTFIEPKKEVCGRTKIHDLPASCCLEYTESLGLLMN